MVLALWYVTIKSLSLGLRKRGRRGEEELYGEEEAEGV